MVAVAVRPAGTGRRMMEANFLSTFMLTHAALRLLRRSNHGRIVNVSSIAVPLRLEGEAVYAAAKSAVGMFTRITGQEGGGWGIMCNSLGPTPIPTRLIGGVPEAELKVLI